MSNDGNASKELCITYIIIMYNGARRRHFSDISTLRRRPHARRNFDRKINHRFRVAILTYDMCTICDTRERLARRPALDLWRMQNSCLKKCFVDPKSPPRITPDYLFFSYRHSCNIHTTTIYCVSSLAFNRILAHGKTIK